MNNDDTHAHWRDSALTPKFFIIDARAAFAILILLLRPHWYTLVFAIVVIVLLGILTYLNLPLSVAFRVIKGWISGPRKFLVYRK